MSVVDDAKRYNTPIILVHTLMALPLLKAIINNSYGIPLTIRIQNPSSTDKGPESSTWNLEYTAWIPESKTLLDSLT